MRVLVFENEQGEVVTVNGDRYRAMLNEFWFTEIEEEDIGIDYIKRPWKLPLSKIGYYRPSISPKINF